VSRRRGRGSDRQPRPSGGGSGAPAQSGTARGRGPAQGGGGRPGRPAQGGAGRSGSAWTPGAPAPNRQPPRLSFVAQVGVLVAVFAVVSLIADVAGAANLGVALGIGVIAFAIALVVTIVKN
jgi:hypothetical protein